MDSAATLGWRKFPRAVAVGGAGGQGCPAGRSDGRERSEAP